MKYAQKSKVGSVTAVMWGVIAMLLAVLVGCAVAAWLLHDGRFAESLTPITATITRIVGAVAATIVTWLLSAQTPLRNAIIAVATSLLLLIILSMLLWQIDVPAIPLGLVTTGAAVLASIFVLSRKKGGSMRKVEKLNIVKMYKNRDR